eukprot:Gb_07603 [translate_table: standard]
MADERIDCSVWTASRTGILRLRLKMVLNCCMQILRRVVNPLRLCLAPLCLCLTAVADDDTLSTKNDQIADYTQISVAFLHREEPRTEEEFPEAITEAIRSSSVHIAIFSPHYAQSYWCLRELSLMLKTPNGTIIPVFYNVTPGEVRWGKGAFAEAFDKHYRRYSREMVDEWKAMIKEEVLKRIKSEPLTVAKFPVGLEEPVAQLREYITRCRMVKNHVAFVGIIGIGGIGKTTMVKSIFNNIRWDLNFKRASYIEDIKGEEEKKGLQEVQRKLLHSLLDCNYQVPDLSQGQQIINKRLSNIDALIVLDNIEDKKQLDAILSPEILLPGSTLIVTSRESNIFKHCNNFLKYEMPGLSLSLPKELFCRHVFDNGVACAPFENLVDKFVGICKCIPLALEICGGKLYGESYATWVNYSKKISETMLVELKSILQVSYARLDEKQKQIFLDIAIFFHGQSVHTLERIWEERIGEEESENSFTYDLMILERKCMIKMAGDGIKMHEAF